MFVSAKLSTFRPLVCVVVVAVTVVSFSGEWSSDGGSVNLNPLSGLSLVF